MTFKEKQESQLDDFETQNKDSYDEGQLADESINIKINTSSKQNLLENAKIVIDLGKDKLEIPENITLKNYVDLTSQPKHM